MCPCCRFVLLAIASLDVPSFADDITIPSVNVEFGQPQSGNESATTVQILLFFTVIAIAPSILLMMTCFTRIIIIFSFVRRALATQTTPPNQVLIGLALFLTFFIMSPVLSEVKTKCIRSTCCRGDQSRSGNRQRPRTYP